MAYCIVRGGIVSIGVALFCWVESNLLFDQSSWLMMILYWSPYVHVQQIAPIS